MIKSSSSSFLVALVVTVLIATTKAFSPASRPVLTPGRLIPGRTINKNSNSNMASFVLQAAAEQDEETSSKVDADGTYYDDEVEPAPKVGISDSMKERLMREASTGLDAEKKQTNVLLYIIVGVAVLVALGGQGILF